MTVVLTNDIIRNVQVTGPGAQLAVFPRILGIDRVWPVDRTRTACTTREIGVYAGSAISRAYALQATVELQ
jgi:hypothetical protein